MSGQARYWLGSVLAEELPGFLVDEMKPGAGKANDGHIGIGIGLVLRRGLGKPMLHVRAQPWAFEKDMSAHRRNMQKPPRRVTSVCWRRWRFRPREMRGRGLAGLGRKGTNRGGSDAGRNRPLANSN